MSGFGSVAQGFFLSTMRLLFGLALCVLLGAAACLFRLPPGHFLSLAFCFMLGAHLLLLGGPAGLLLDALHFGLLLTTCRLLGLALCHLLRVLRCFMLCSVRSSA